MILNINIVTIMILHSIVNQVLKMKGWKEHKIIDLMNIKVKILLYFILIVILSIIIPIPISSPVTYLHSKKRKSDGIQIHAF